MFLNVVVQAAFLSVVLAAFIRDVGSIPVWWCRQHPSVMVLAAFLCGGVGSIPVVVVLAAFLSA